MGEERDAEEQTRSQDDMQISKTSTEPIIMAGPDTAAMVANAPYIASMNVNKSVGVHIGTKVVSITQNVQNTEGVRGHFLGLELLSADSSKRLRCSVAIFVCWALVVVSTLLIGFLFYVFSPTRLDIDMPFPQYLLTLIKDTTKAERAATIGVIVGLVLCISIVTYVVFTWGHHVVDVAPHEWNITRQMWLARPVDHSNTTLLFSPVDLVVIQHSVSPECSTFAACASEMRNLQDYYIDTLHYDDISYNFQVGNDGRVYEGRGWGVQGAHTLGYNRCSVGIGFIGDYREDYNMRTKVTAAQINRTQLLLEYGVKMGYLLPNYKVVGGMDLRATVSPGSNLYKAIQKWSHYDHQHIYKDKTCDQIHLIINNKKTT